MTSGTYHRPRRLAAGLLLLPVGWLVSRQGMSGHMTGHMIAVAIAAPLLAAASADTSIDPATRLPRLVTPMGMMLVELAAVWGWHLPALRSLAHRFPIIMVAEQASFLTAGYLLWSAVLHTHNRAAGIGALLLTSMHMTLLGVLIGLAPRPIYSFSHARSFGLTPLADQQLGGAIMLLIGAVSYLAGGLVLLSSLLRGGRESAR